MMATDAKRKAAEALLHVLPLPGREAGWAREARAAARIRLLEAGAPARTDPSWTYNDPAGVTQPLAVVYPPDPRPATAKAKGPLADAGGKDPADALGSTLGLEKEINTFFRLHSPSVIARLREAFPDLPDAPDAKTVFIKLRELRNSW